MTFAQQAAMLTGEPYNFGFEQIANMTDLQISRIVCHPRNKDGTLKLPARKGSRVKHAPVPPPELLGVPDAAFAFSKPDGTTPPAEFTVMYYQVWLSRGMPVEKVTERYRDYLKGGG